MEGEKPFPEPWPPAHTLEGPTFPKGCFYTNIRPSHVTWTEGRPPRINLRSNRNSFKEPGRVANSSGNTRRVPEGKEEGWESGFEKFGLERSRRCRLEREKSPSSE